MRLLMLLVLLSLPVMGVTMNNTLIRSNGLDTQFNVTVPSLKFGSLTIDSYAIFLENLSQSDYGNVATYDIDINVTERNASYAGSDLPSVNFVAPNYQYIYSNLSDNVNVSLSTVVESCGDVKAVRFLNSDGVFSSSSNVCSGNRLVTNLVGVGQGRNTLYFDYNVSLVNCSANASVVVQLWDENHPDWLLNNTLEVDVEYWYHPLFRYNLSLVMGGKSNYSLCLDGAPGAQSNWYFKYYSAYGFTNRYYLVNQSLSNSSATVLDMYNFNDTVGKSTVKLTLRDRDTYSFVSGLYVKWQRYYVAESVWRTVQMDKSGDFGLTIFHVLEETTDYRFLVFDQFGRLLKTSESVKFVCPLDKVCEVETVVVPYASGGEVVSLWYSVSYDNATKVIRADWSDLGGNVQSLRWSVEKQTMRGSTVLCAETQTGAGGTLLCNVSGVEGTVAVRLYRTASPEAAFFTKLYDLAGLKLADKIGDRNGALILGAMLVTGAGFGVVSPVIGVVVTVFMVFVGAGLGLMGALTTTIVLTVGIMGVVVGLLLRK